MAVLKGAEDGGGARIILEWRIAALHRAEDGGDRGSSVEDGDSDRMGLERRMVTLQGAEDDAIARGRA